MISRSRTPRLAGIALVALSLTGACSKLTEYTPTTNRYGSVNIEGNGTSATTVSALPSGVFFEATSAGVPNSAGADQQSDACVFSSIDPGTSGAGFDAGTALSLAIGSQTVSLPFSTTTGRYAMPTAQRFNYTAGETVQVTVPGSTNFPASAISVKLAEPILPGAAVIPAANAPLVVTWNATNDATSAVLISVRYANPASSTTANEQIFCSAKDDGRFEIISGALTALRASPASLRSLTLTRFRTNETLLPDGRTLLHVATTVDSTVALP